MDSSEEQSRKIAHDAEKDLNSYGAKAGHGMATSKGYEAQTSKGLTSDSSKNPSYLPCPACDCLPFEGPLARESGVDKAVENKFPGAHVVYGSAAPGSGGDKIIPAQEGGDQLPGRGGGR